MVFMENKRKIDEEQSSMPPGRQAIQVAGQLSPHSAVILRKEMSDMFAQPEDLNTEKIAMWLPSFPVGQPGDSN